MAEYIQEYVNTINKRFKTGISTEHSYRSDLQNLIEHIAPGILVTNEPARIECGAPDYIITKGNIPIGYIEAKDVGKSLQSKDYKEQFSRYKASLNNLIITNYLEFQLYKDGLPVSSISLAVIHNNRIVPVAENFEAFQNIIKEFCTYTGQTITSASKLSKMMANKARLLANVIENVLIDESTGSTLHDQMKAFQEILIHDIEPKEFADIYAQTIAYGMFAARLHDTTLKDFSRQEAAVLIPKTNPFLRKLFQYIAGYDLDDRIKWIVDALADVFRATDVASLLQDFGKVTQRNDPMIHFYETFLSEYNPKLRKSRGVWYTPEPVVNFIVRAVDDILKAEFGLNKGLADTSRTTIEIDTKIPDKRSKTGYKREKRKVHKVQILDPACGTGTFLAEVVKQVYKSFEGQQGIWSNYVKNHLIPRLNGFEILMASYAMAHLKLELLLKETGHKPINNERLNIYLTNSLEEYHPDTGSLFANWLSKEANEANYIKKDVPVMVVLGNPPYSISSSNKGKWIQNLIYDYKKDLYEKNIQPLSDDYIKFIRFGQYLINKTNEGILAFISNNSFLDGIIHRQMRKNLMQTFDKIYILNLHGDSKKQEKCPDGTKDENIFDIMQGVSITLFIKNHKNSKNDYAQLSYIDFYGTRKNKYNKLFSSNINTIKWRHIKPNESHFFFVDKDFSHNESYERFFSISELFQNYNSGVQTEFDLLSVAESEKVLKNMLNSLLSDSTEEIIEKYGFSETQMKKIDNAREDAKHNSPLIIDYNYRIFDCKKALYTGVSNGIMGRPRGKTMRHLLKQNISLIVPKQTNIKFRHSFVSKLICDANLIASAKKFGCGSVFPLYSYSEFMGQQSIDVKQIRMPNLNTDIVKEISQIISSTFIPEKKVTNGTFAPIDILDYIYAALHSPSYREKYKEFLKIDFPRVPYPKDKKTFWKLVNLGSQLRQIHLLESQKVEEYITVYPIDGDNRITRRIGKSDFEINDKRKQLGRIWINDQQYFDKVPLIAWEFYIGGYQPAQKWLKDRRSRELSFEDILHYQKIIVALSETDKIMKEIDKVDFL
ncbi:type ISP restriction/modification enzyme [candidate division KSB1 bacterium]